MVAAGYIKRIDIRDFPTNRHGTQTIMLSPNREKVTLLSAVNRNHALLVSLAIEAALGVPLWRLRSKGGKLVEGLEQMENAVIRLTFWNEGEGPEAFEPHVYGRQIILERQLSWISERCSVLRMANEKGSVVATDEESVDRMLEHFRIFVGHPLLQVDRCCMDKALQCQPENLYSMFLQAHRLDSEGLEEAMRQEQADLSSLRKVRALKEGRAEKLREEARELQRQLGDWEESTAELKLCLHLAHYRQHRQELATKQEILAQTERQRQDAIREMTSLNELLSTGQERIEKLSSSLAAHDALMDECKQKLKKALTLKTVAEQELAQVQRDKSLMVKELSRLELASRLASRKGRAKGDRQVEKKEQDRVALQMALNCSHAALSADHRQACKQASKQRRKERSLMKKLKQLGSQIVAYEADIDKFDLVKGGRREELAHATATVSQIKLKLGPAQDALNTTENDRAELKATVDSLEQKCSESLTAARQFVSMKDNHNTILAKNKSKDSDDKPAKTIVEELKMLLDHGVATADPVVYETKLLQRQGPTSKTYTSKQYRVILNQLDTISEEIRKASKEERDFVKQSKLERQQYLYKCTEAADGWFQHFLAGFHGRGGARV